MKNLRWQAGAVLDPPNISVAYRHLHTQSARTHTRDLGANATRSTVHLVSPREQASGILGGRDRLPADLEGERRVQAASREPILVRADGQSTARLVDGPQPRSPSLEREFAGQRPESTHLRKEQDRRRERSTSTDPVSAVRAGRRVRFMVPLQQQDSAPWQPLHRQESPSDAPGRPAAFDHDEPAETLPAPDAQRQSAIAAASSRCAAQRERE